MIEAARSVKKAAHVMGNEFFGVTALSFVGGFADTAGFIVLFGLFTAHVTGDLVTGADAPAVPTGVLFIFTIVTASRSRHVS